MRLNTTAKKPFAGMFANFDPPHKEAADHPSQPYPILWAFLSKYAASIINKNSHQLIASRAISNKGKGYYYLARIEGYHSLFLNALVKRDFDRALEFGLKYSKLLACLPDRNDPSRAFEPEENERFNPKSISSWVEAFPGLVLEPILMAIYAMDERVEIPIGSWLSHFGDPFSSQSYWSKTILKAFLDSSPKIPDLAIILLLVGEATGANWPSEMLSKLKKYANS